LLIAVSFLFAPRRLMDGAVIVSACSIGGTARRLNLADGAGGDPKGLEMEA
jgi:hypothetical protein